MSPVFYDWFPRVKDRLVLLAGRFAGKARPVLSRIPALSSFQKKALALVLGLYVVAYGIFGGWLNDENRSDTYRQVVGIAFFPLLKIFPLRAGLGRDLSVLSVKVVTAEDREVFPKISAAGIIDYYEKVDIAPKTSGRISQLFVKEGDIVRKGQRLCELERVFLELEMTKETAARDAALSELRLSQEKYISARRGIEGRFREIEKQETLVKRLKAELDKQRTTFQGKEVLLNEGAISQEEFNQAKTELITKEAAFLMSRKDLEIASVGFRDQDILERGAPLPKDQTERTSALLDVNSAIQKAEVDVARSRVKSAEAQLSATRTLLKEAMILSPITGLVATLNKHPGEQVQGGATASQQQAIMTLVGIERVYARMNVKESDLKDIKNGLKMGFTADSYADKKFEGVVEIINPVVDPKTHTFEVKAILKNTGLLLRPGMFIRTNLITGAARKVTLVPLTAFLPKEENNGYVFVVKQGGVVYPTEVKTGTQYDDFIEIVSGLPAGSVVASEKLSQLKEGTKIRAALASASEPKPGE